MKIIKHHAFGQDEYANGLVRHFLIGTPKPRFPRGYRPTKEYPDDCVLNDEQLFDLSALLTLLQDIDKECQGPPQSVLDTYFFCRDEIEEALACLLAPFCVDDESPVFLPEYNRDIKEFNDDLNNYLLALRTPSTCTFQSCSRGTSALFSASPSNSRGNESSRALLSSAAKAFTGPTGGIKDCGSEAGPHRGPASPFCPMTRLVGPSGQHRTAIARGLRPARP